MEETAILAGGCFWCMVAPFDTFPGIHKIVSGYTGGTTKNPTYEQVKTQKTGHTEAVKITFDSSVITFKSLLDIYWNQTDPTDASGQFQDRGSSYRPVIFYKNESQRKDALESKEKLEQSGKYDQPIVTTIEPASIFYLAEEEHQDFYKKNSERYELEKEERKAYSSKKKGSH